MFISMHVTSTGDSGGVAGDAALDAAGDADSGVVVADVSPARRRRVRSCRGGDASRGGGAVDDVIAEGAVDGVPVILRHGLVPGRRR